MKKIISITLSLLILFMLCNCTKKTPNPNEKEPVNIQKQIAVSLYYANEKYIETGNEELEKFIVVKKPIDLKNNNIVLSIVNELKKNPNINNATTGIPENVAFLDGKIKDKIAYVDVSSENLSGSSLQEFFVINQILYSLTFLDDIEKVQFLIDGKKEESLMGHFLINEPLSTNVNP
ncbi:GerMN domain-containing protein [Crassaminicella profunda]|uniref:GerMN domain-containing protein n=1 Tax=Crassaminicella profunda TaxID=1286698 RepID=UPI001CA77952|nr:GerMN domain-containing protein [Crassaminicella profunda]QZY54844.1 GerMN domain-containing protein [Crassaminicella profunda]